MPSSHLRMEEATSIIASKPICDEFGGRPEIDDLDDFVLQIDENEINNEIKANGIIEDVAIGEIKKMENNEEEITKTGNLEIETEGIKCRRNSKLEDDTDKKSSDLKDKDQSISTSNLNGLCDTKNTEMEAKIESKNNSEINLNVESNNTDSINVTTNEKTVESVISTENNEAIKIEVEKNKTIENNALSGDTNEELNVNELNNASPEVGKEETNEFINENLESVDKELDSLLSMEPDISTNQSNNVSEPMDVDPPSNGLPVLKMTPIEHSPSILSYLQNSEEDKMDSDVVNDQNTPSDSLTFTMHSPHTLTNLDENSSSSDGFFKENTVERFSNIIKTEGETEGTMNEELVYLTVKHIQVSAQSNVLKENNNSEKRLKREADEETSNDQKKIKLENDKIEEAAQDNNVEDNEKLNHIETKESDSNSESSDDSGSSTGSDSSDESTDMDTAALNAAILNQIRKKNNKLINEELSPEIVKEIMEARQKLFSNYFEGKPDINLNRYVLEEMVVTQIIEIISYKTDVGQLRQKCRILQSEQIRLNQMVNALKRQADNARLIIKRLIDEKANNKSWTQNAIPLKVTRSVGLQVCTCGSMTVRSKFSEKEIKSDNVVARDTNDKTNKESVVNKVGPFDNKENISSNIEKDNESNKDCAHTDDVVIVSVTENNSTSSSTVTDKSNISTLKKCLEAPKNGIVSSEKVVRKPLSVEYTNSPTVSNKMSVAPSKTKLSSDNSLVDKEPSQSLKTNVSEIIDLTDKEDHPVKKSDGFSKPVPTSTSFEKQATGSIEKSKKNINPQSNPLVAVNGIKKSSLSHSITSNKKSVDIAPAADLVNSYDHLPKYPVSHKYPANVIKPPRPILRIGKNTSGKQGIMLSWSFEGGRNPPNIEEYQLYAYQESKNSEKLKTDTWKKVGDIKALPLPMACFLTQFVEGHKYHFIVRAVDTQKRLGDFSLPGSIILHAAGQPPSAS